MGAEQQKVPPRPEPGFWRSLWDHIVKGPPSRRWVVAASRARRGVFDMPRDTVDPVLSDDGEWETHPAFGKATLGRAQVSPPGASLFDSDIRHGEIVVLRIHTAERKRGLNRDWIHADKQLIEIEMSLSQWAALISSFGMGDGVPVTITHIKGEGKIPSIPFAPRMATQVDETVQTASRQYDKVREALAAYQAHKTVRNLRDLESAINNVESNIRYAANMLTEHVESTVTQAKADLEAMVHTRAQQLGIDPADFSAPLEIEGA